VHRSMRHRLRPQCPGVGMHGDTVEPRKLLLHWCGLHLPEGCQERLVARVLGSGRRWEHQPWQRLHPAVRSRLHASAGVAHVPWCSVAAFDHDVHLGLVLVGGVTGDRRLRPHRHLTAPDLDAVGCRVLLDVLSGRVHATGRCSLRSRGRGRGGRPLARALGLPSRRRGGRLLGLPGLRACRGLPR